MSLRPSEFAELLAELQLLIGRRATKLWSPSPTTVVFRLKGPGVQDDLVLEVAHPRARLGVVRERPRGEPSDFQAQLRAELEGCRLEKIEQPLAGDRIVDLSFAHREGGARLVAELLGSRGNLLLLGAGGELVAAGRPALLGGRGLSIGEAYALPAARAEAGPEASRWSPLTESDFPLSAALEEHYGPLDREALLSDERRTLRRSLSRARKKHARIVHQLEEATAGATEAPRIQQQGELLKTVVGKLRRGQSEVRVRDYYDPEGGEIVLPLDPKLGPKENLEAYFKRARKLLRGAKVAGERLGPTRKTEAALAGLLAAVEIAESPERFEELWREARSLGVRRPAPPAPKKTGGGKKAAPSRKPYRSFLSSSGDHILVGRSARDNHALTFQVARGRDVWLHVRDYPGSHVVIRGTGSSGGAESVDPMSLREAGLLAAHFSEGREAGPVEVSWTERKHLRHPPGSAPGLVAMAKARSLRVVPDPDRLQALFGREE